MIQFSSKMVISVHEQDLSSLLITGSTQETTQHDWNIIDWDLKHQLTGPHSAAAVGSESNCRSNGCEFDPSPVPYFCGD